MKASNPREGQGGFESEVVGEEPVMETRGAERWAQQPALDQAMSKLREERILPRRKWSGIITLECDIGVGLQMMLYRSI